MDLLWSKQDSSDPQLRQFIGASARVCFFVCIELPWLRFLSWVGDPLETYETRALDAQTWPDFVQLVEANNGVWGGCWCMWYHTRSDRADDTPELRQKAKQCLVKEGRAHACLVFQGADCVGWCQFGSPQELPRIHNQRAYLATDPALPDWRITCFFAGNLCH